MLQCDITQQYSCDGANFLVPGVPSLSHDFVCACACVCFRWFRPWPVMGPTPYGNTVSWTLLRCRAVVGNPTPRTKSSEYTPCRLDIHRATLPPSTPSPTPHPVTFTGGNYCLCCTRMLHNLSEHNWCFRQQGEIAPSFFLNALQTVSA